MHKCILYVCLYSALLSFEVGGQTVVVTGQLSIIRVPTAQAASDPGAYQYLMKILECRGTNENDFSRDISSKKPSYKPE